MRRRSGSHRRRRVDESKMQLRFGRLKGETISTPINEGAARRATMRRPLATCPGLLFENPGAQIARPVALERTSTNLGQMPQRNRWAGFGPTGPTPG